MKKPFLADEFVAFLQERFRPARIERTSNEHGTIWIEVRTDAGHAEIVVTADGVIGARDMSLASTTTLGILRMVDSQPAPVASGGR